MNAAEAIGLDEKTLELVKILPLVYVAWADGEVQSEELAFIKEQASELGLHNDESIELLEKWLSERPAPDFFNRGLRLLSFLLATQPEEDAKAAAKDVTALCEAVAKAAGGLSGHAVKIEAHEQIALRQVSVRLDLGSRPTTRKALSDLMEMLADKDA